LRVNIDGTQSNLISLTQKTYASGAELAAELQTLINNDTALKATNASVSVQYVDNRLQIQSNRQGTSSRVEVTQVGIDTTATLGLATGQGIATIEDATRGSLTGVDLAVAPITVNADNDTFSLKVNGVQSGTINLTAQAYGSHTDLATELQTRINADATLKAAGAQVQVSVVNNRLQIQSTRYGTDSQVEITGVDTLTSTTLGLAVASGVAGKGIQGQGQLLTAASGDANGLSMLIEGTQTGSRGTVDFARGLIEVLNKTLASSLDTQGTVSARTKGLNTSIEIITRRRADLNKRMEGYQRQLYIRFNAMDSILGKLQTTSTFLTQQINALNAANKQN
jgi:flagellar hook-associated protein 2